MVTLSQLPVKITKLMKNYVSISKITVPNCSENSQGHIQEFHKHLK